MADHNLLGKKGEELAVVFFKQLNYEIIEINWQQHKYEIDIIAKNNKEIIFIEVKTRSTDFFGAPEDAVTNSKQKHLIDGADFYLQKMEIDLDARFDVLSIVINNKGQEIKHIIDAFYPEA